MYLKLFALLTLLTLFGGCTTGKTLPQQQVHHKLPSWIENTPKNDALKLWGIGIAQTREAAVKAALEELVSKLKVSLSSSFTLKQRATNYVATKEIQQELDLKIEKITLHHYEIERTALLSSGEYAVLVRSQKKSLARNLQREIENETKEIKQELQALQNRAKIFWAGELRTLQAKAQKPLSYAYIVKELDPSFQTKSCELLMEEIKKELCFAKENYGIFIETDKRYANYSDTLRRHLQSRGFTIDHNLQKNSTKLLLSLKKEKKEVYGVVLFVVEIQLRVFDLHNKLLGEKIYTLRTRPTTEQQSFAEVLEKDPPLSF